MVPRRRRCSSRIHYEPHPTNLSRGETPGTWSWFRTLSTWHCSRTARWCEFLGLGQGCRKNYTGRQNFKNCQTFSQQTVSPLSTGVKCQVRLQLAVLQRRQCLPSRDELASLRRSTRHKSAGCRLQSIPAVWGRDCT